MDAAVEIYNRLSVDLLPTPAKSHYVFNLRDLSKCVQGETCKYDYHRLIHSLLDIKDSANK